MEYEIYTTWKGSMASHSHVLVYHGPLQFTFWEWLAIYFHYGVLSVFHFSIGRRCCYCLAVLEFLVTWILHSVKELKDNIWSNPAKWLYEYYRWEALNHEECPLST